MTDQTSQQAGWLALVVLEIRRQGELEFEGAQILDFTAARRDSTPGHPDNPWSGVITGVVWKPVLSPTTTSAIPPQGWRNDIPERSEYLPGIFSWIDCATTDQEATKTFYSNLFGWTFMDMPVPEGGTYSMASLKGQSVAGLFTKPPDAGPTALVELRHRRRCWRDGSQSQGTRSPAAGEPFDVMEAGRMAVLQDSEGAVVSAWQPNQNTGAGTGE